MKHPGGKPMDRRRAAYVKKFDIRNYRVWRYLTYPLMDQLDACSDDMARRILLGVSK